MMNESQHKVKIKRALISVSDKSGLPELSSYLREEGIEVYASGGTAQALKSLEVKVQDLQKITQNPEAFGGRMKTLSFQVMSALLYRRDKEEDLEEANKLKIQPIDLVVCDFYPFEKVMEGKDDQELIENIDIGGPCMVRAGAKNFQSVTVLTHPKQYAPFLEEIKKEGGTTLEFRKDLALEAFALTAHYDHMIAYGLNQRFQAPDQKLRYGENPHQEAVIVPRGERSQTQSQSWREVPLLQGKAMSYNNFLDADAAWRAGSEVSSLFDSSTHTVCVVKHNLPAGLATSQHQTKALELAWASDPVSAFGGILFFSHEVNEESAKWLSTKFIELIIAPSFDEKAIGILSKKKNLRLLIQSPRENTLHEVSFRSIFGATLMQKEDEGIDLELQSVTQNAFPSDLHTLAKFGISVTKFIKSNGITLVAKNEDGDFFIVASGAGQPNRIDSLSRLAVPRAKEREDIQLSECVMVSDAFFPFADIIEVAHEAGVQRIVQPGGSVRDQEVIDRANKFGMQMIFTGRRHFRH